MTTQLLSHTTRDEDLKDQVELDEYTSKGHTGESESFNFEQFERYDSEQTAAMSRRMVRKIDFRVLPILTLLFILNILDRNNIANSKIAGMTTDLQMYGLDYNNMVLVLFVGYVFAQVPVGLVLARLPAALFLSGAVCAWGLVSMCCGFVHSVAAMTALRGLVGICEAPFFPGAVLILSSFYNRKELAIRVSIMYSGNSLSNGFGSILAAAIIAGMDGKAGLAGWRWLFIIEGLITVVVGVAVAFVLASVPSKAKWLTEEERRLAAWRLQCDAAGEADEGGETSMKKGLILVVKDWKLLLLVLQQMFISCVQSFTYFFPSIVKSLGFGTNQTLLMSGPPYFLAFFLSVGVALSSSRLNERAWHIAIPMFASFIGNILCFSLPLSNVAGRYIAMFLLPIGTYCAFNLGIAWVSAVAPRPRIKRGAALSMVNGLANASHFFTPYMFPDSDSPYYRSGGIALAVFSCTTGLTAITIKYVLQRQNRRMREMDEKEEEYKGHLDGIPKGYVFAT